MITPSRLSADWAPAERRLRRFLGTAGAVGALADDIVQEVATRALSTGLAYETVDELVRWSCTVARNLLVTEHRRSSRLCAAGDVEPASSSSADRQALDRLEVEEALAAITQLSARDQEILLGQLQPPPRERDRKADVRANVALFRARGRLQQLLAGALTPVVLVWDRWQRRLGHAITVTTAIACTLPLALLTLGGPDRVPEREGPVPAVEPAVPPVPDREARRPPAAAMRTTTTRVDRSASPTPTVRRPPDRSLVTAPPTTISIRTPAAANETVVREKQDDDHLFCIGNLGVAPDQCVGR